MTFYPEAARWSVRNWPPGWALVRLLAVTPENRRHGIGRALMVECLRRARAASARAIGLHTDQRMPVPQRLYAQMGFRRAREFDYQPVPGEDFTVMGWRLDLASWDHPEELGRPSRAQRA